jgi:plastocyanin
MPAKIIAAALAALAFDAAPPLQAQPAPSALKIANFTFAPQTITVPVGTTVTWANDDDVPHTVVATDGAFRSKPLDTDDHYAVTFKTPGEHSYFCSIHPRMTGKVIVKG